MQSSWWKSNKLSWCVVLAVSLLMGVQAASAAPAAKKAGAPAPSARKQTVCTITVNSADEKETFRRYLPASKYNFVELVEPGRPDWLASSCRAKVACDVLVISGHYDGGNSFFSDRLEVREFLPVTELERVSCSGSCPSLFSRLKEVYLFGCNTLNPAPQSSASAEIIRDLVHEGLSPKEAQRRLQSLDAAHGESSRERMRQIFKDVPVIYGFASTAPLGPVAAFSLDRYLRNGGRAEVGQGRASRALLRQFSTFSLTSAEGMRDKDPHIGAREDMCHFADERPSIEDKLRFVHTLLQRSSTEARLYLDRIQRLTATLDDNTRHQLPVARALADITRDGDARRRFLDEARDADQPQVRVRLLDVARDLGWLTDDQRWQELALMLGELQARKTIGVPEIDLACRLNREGDLDGAFSRRGPPGGGADDVAHAAVRACLASSEGHTRVLDGLVSTQDADVQAAQAYLRHRPVTDPDELRRLTDRIAAMEPGAAQVRALDTLGRHYVSDGVVLDTLGTLYARTPSPSVQNAIAGVLIRADRKAMAQPELARMLTQHRKPAKAGSDSNTVLVDALINRLQTP